ncbi:MAG TPA: hypothetical protein VGE72_14855 [Azospirillum sp.]
MLVAKQQQADRHQNGDGKRRSDRDDPKISPAFHHTRAILPDMVR